MQLWRGALPYARTLNVVIGGESAAETFRRWRMSRGVQTATPASGAVALMIIRGSNRPPV